MALDLNVESLDSVPEAVRSLYKEKEGGGFVLEVSGIEDTGALKRAKDHEVAERKKVEARLATIDAERKAETEKARKAAEDAARAAGDTKALEESWKKKHADDVAAARAEFEPKVQKLDSTVRRLLVSDVATRIAGELAIPGSAGPLAKLISDRLAVEEIDGEHVTVVRDANGKPSALTIEDLKKEISNDKALAPLLVGSKGSGGGASGDRKGGGAPGAKTITRAAFEALDPAGRQAFIRGKGTVSDT
jgi:hypothetical protein